MQIRNFSSTPSPSFGSLRIAQKDAEALKKDYGYVLDRLEEHREELDKFKHWDLKVQAEPYVNNTVIPYFTVINKDYGNEYETKPFMVFETGNNHLFMQLRIPKENKDKEYSCRIYKKCKEKDRGMQEIYLPYQEQAEVAKKNRTINKIMDNQYYWQCKKEPDGYCKLPLYMVRELEKKSNEYAEGDLNRGFIQPTPTKLNDVQTTKEVTKQVVDKPVGTEKGFAKVAGMDELKNELREDVILPLQQPELYRKYGIEPANGVMLYGPPGTGKTFIAEALAEESGRNFIRMDIPETISSYMAVTSQKIDNLFKTAADNAPSIIFIDEFEAIAPSRSTLNGSTAAAVDVNQQVNTLLQNLNNCAEKGIFVIAATNEPQKIDAAVKRAGRFDKTVFVPPPDLKARKELLQKALGSIYSEENIDYDNLAKLTANYTAPEIKQILVRGAAKTALKQNRKISESDVIEQIKTNEPQLNDKLVEEYRNKGTQDKKGIFSAQRNKIGFLA